jgi:acyl-homoserine-lactone acylase
MKTLAIAALALLLFVSAPSPAPVDAPAEIRRDVYGVAHITGPTERAVAFAHGYAVAEDHGPELARLFLRARGEQASVFGEKFLAEDVRIQVFGIHRVAEERLPSLPPHVRAILEGYAAGYNRYLLGHRSDMPSWAAPIAAVDVLAHCRAVVLLDFALDLRGWRDSKPPSAAAGTPQGSDDLHGSNMWAIGRARAATGRGVLLANPHLPWSGAHVFHEVHLTVPGTIDVYGATLIGFPVVAIGFNEYVGWSHTVNAHDSQDFYRLERDPANPARYRYEDGWRELSTAVARVQVKEGDTLRWREVPYLQSHYGPAFEQDANTAIALKSANLDSVEFLDTWNRMGKAHSVAALQQALEGRGLPMFNVGAVDREGHIYSQYAGRIPVRDQRFDWAGIVPGNTRETEWHGLHPLSDLPHLLDPTPAYIQNCNDPPWLTNLHARLDPTRYPTYMRLGTGLSLRGQRSLQLLEADADVTLQEAMQYKHDVRVVVADRLKPELIARATADSATDASLPEAIAVLRGWDDMLSSDSAGGVLFTRWVDEYSRRTRQVFAEPWDPDRPLATPRGLGDPTAAVAALSTAAAAIKKEQGRLDVPWGSVHRFRKGAIDLPIAGGSGQYGVFRVLSFRPDADGKVVAAGGDSFVLAAALGPGSPQAYSVLAYSESADPKSKHFADQSALFAAGTLKQVLFTAAAIAAQTERRYRPEEPATSPLPLGSTGGRPALPDSRF